MSFQRLLQFTPDYKGCCPHCGTGVQFRKSDSQELPWISCKSTDKSEVVDEVHLIVSKCPICKKLIVLMNARDPQTNTLQEIMAWPLWSSRPPIPANVPESIREDYEEAARVLPFSAKASAALSRRCLQHILIEAGKAKSDILEKQIDEVRPILPRDLGDNLHYVRKISNFAAHPEKNKATGIIIDVEPGEAEWNLDVIDGLFGYFYERPAREQKRRSDFDAKLAAMGKRPISNP